jgi:hypothetical protein
MSPKQIKPTKLILQFIILFHVFRENSSQKKKRIALIVKEKLRLVECKISLSQLRWYGRVFAFMV